MTYELPLLDLTGNSRKANQPQQPGTTLPTPLLEKLKTKWLKPPLEH
jgi:hypothetical protein